LINISKYGQKSNVISVMFLLKKSIKKICLAKSFFLKAFYSFVPLNKIIAFDGFQMLYYFNFVKV